MKVYIVIEYGGEWEDSWEHISGVCSSPELAQKLADKIKQAHSSLESISKDKYGWRGVKIRREDLLENESELTSNKWK